MFKDKDTLEKLSCVPANTKCNCENFVLIHFIEQAEKKSCVWIWRALGMLEKNKISSRLYGLRQN